MPAFEWCAGTMHPLKCPGVTIRPAELPTDDGHCRSLGRCSDEEVAQTGNPKLAVGLQPAQQRAQGNNGWMNSMVIGADEDGDLPRSRPFNQSRTQPPPGFGKPLGICGQPCADLIP